MKIFLIYIFLLIGSYCSAQHVEYTYDANGNRVTRTWSSHRMKNPALEIDSSAIVEAKYGIKIFPNPTSGNINVSISTLEDGENGKVYFSDDQGKVLIIRDQASKLETIDISNFKPGIYYIKVYIKEENVSYKIVKL